MKTMKTMKTKKINKVCESVERSNFISIEKLFMVVVVDAFELNIVSTPWFRVFSIRLVKVLKVT